MSNPESPGPRPWILLVDPSEVSRKACREAATNHNLDMRIAETVPEALTMIYDSKPAAVLVTPGLSVMRGNVLVSALSSSTGHRSIPVALIVQSDAAVAGSEELESTTIIDRREGMEASVDEFLERVGIQREAGSKAIVDCYKPRILLAEDSPTSQLIIARMLHVGGADVTVVEDGGEALTAAEENEYDIILMDIEMPNMDGLEAAEKLRARGVQLPIIAVTGYEERKITSEQFEENFNGFLQKPVTRNDLQVLLRLHCGRRGDAAA